MRLKVTVPAAVIITLATSTGFCTLGTHPPEPVVKPPTETAPSAPSQRDAEGQATK